MDRSRRLGWLLALALWGLAIAAKWPAITSPPYWDEALHYWTAKHLGTRYDAITDIWGNPVGTPAHLLFQRPLFYLAFWGPAQGGFEAFRVTHAIAASALAPLAYLLLRGHGIRRPAAVLGGVAVALAPPIAMWGTLGLMDSLMTAGLAVLLWARATGRHRLMFAAALAAVWTKETAYAAVLGLLAFDGVRDWVNGRMSFAPLRLTPRVTALAYAAALAPWPLMWAVAHDLALPGAPFRGDPLLVADRMFLSAWLMPVLLLGLARSRSRFLCATALAAGAFLLALQLADRDVPQWYEVPTVFLALVGCASAADAWLRDARPRWSAPWPAAVALAVVVMLVVVPNGPARDVLRPLADDAGDGGHSLAGAWRFETEHRDLGLWRAIDQLPLGPDIQVLAVDVAPPTLFVPIVEEAGHVYFDSSAVRSWAEFGVERLAATIEAERTWTLLDRSDIPMAAAIDEVYADCVTYQNPGYTVIHAPSCAGRADRLEAAWRERDPRF